MAPRTTQPRRRLAAPLAAALLAAAVLAACGTDTASRAGDRTTSTVTDGSVADLPQGDDPVKLDPADFTTKIDNPYWPMAPGTRWTYRETDLKDGTTLDVVVIVTDQTKKLANGITARVIRDTVRKDGAIIEDTFDWYAQHRDGAIWYLGENTAEFEGGTISSRDGSFEAGRDGALPGIMIPADPQPGMRYREEYLKHEAEDNGEVLSTNEMADVPRGHYKNLLLTKDTITIEPDVLEYKLYAKGIGPVMVLGVSGGNSIETLIDIDKAPAGSGTGPLGNP